MTDYSNTRIQFRRGSYTQWANSNPVLGSGEPGFDLTNNILKVGDGSTQWASLSGVGGGGGGGNGSTTFVGLLDTPSNFTGAGSKIVAVNSAASALEYITVSSLSITESQISDLGSYLTSVSISDIDSNVIVTETEGIASNDNDTTIPTSAAVKAYVDANAGGSEVNDLSSSVTWATVPDSYISESSVVQHSGAMRITESQIVDLGHTSEVNDLTSSVTWANVPDANITESSVVQHSGALRITESQIVDLGHTTVNIPKSGDWNTAYDTLVAQSGNWNTAYSWGDHSDQDYLTAVSGDTSPSLSNNLDVNNYSLINVSGINGDGTNDTILVGSHLIPSGNSIFDLGEASRKFRHLYLSNSSIKFVGSDDTVRSLSVDGDGNLDFNSSVMASRTYVDTKVADLVNSAPETLDTLDELAAAINDNADILDTLSTKSELTAASGNLQTQITTLNNAGYLTSETNDLSTSVTWANVPDANITESSVVQHSGALLITESQITDLGEYITSSNINIVDDTTPQLGGNLDLQTYDITSNGTTGGDIKLGYHAGVIFGNTYTIITDNANQKVGINIDSPSYALDIGTGNDIYSTTSAMRVKQIVPLDTLLIGSSHAEITTSIAGSIYTSLSVGNGARPTTNKCLSYATNYFSSAGDAQKVSMVVQYESTDASTYYLNAAKTGSYLYSTYVRNDTFLLPPDSSATFTIHLIANNDTDGTSAGWIFRGCVKSVNKSLSFVGSPITENFADSGMSSVTAAIEVQDGSGTSPAKMGGLVIKVNGLASKTIRWVATIDAVLTSF